MRHFHVRKNKYHCEVLNVEKLWSLVPQETREQFQTPSKTGEAPVIDCVTAGYFKVLGKGILPNLPVVVRARYFSKEAERKIKAAGGVCELRA
jgi:ribosomal protein L15